MPDALVIVAGVGVVALWLWILSLAISVPAERWVIAQQSKPLWIAVIILFSLPGAALYLLAVAPLLDRPDV